MLAGLAVRPGWLAGNAETIWVYGARKLRRRIPKNYFSAGSVTKPMRVRPFFAASDITLATCS